MKNEINGYANQAKILRKLAPSVNNWDIVNSSANHFEKRTGTTLGNTEQRIGAYLLRLAEISKSSHTKYVKQQLFDKMLTEYQDIPDSYWNLQVQIARDEGRQLNLDSWYKNIHFREAHRAQKTSLAPWINYVCDHKTYPVWFKVFALDGVSKMANFNVEKKVFNKRSRGSVSPFPNLNPAVLSNVYDAVSQGQEAGNFNKLYSTFFNKYDVSRVEVPENEQDIRGRWIHYGPDDIDKLVDAAQGTPWCIAGEEMAISYLLDMDGEFYLFHLIDPEQKQPYKTASASIRLAYGQVSELSGTANSDQTVHPSLLETVLKKATSLPGGDVYCTIREDMKRLAELDRKSKSGEELSLDELSFIYELERPIEYLYGYNDDDDDYDNDNNSQEDYQESSYDEFYKPFAHGDPRLIEITQNVGEHLRTLKLSGVDIAPIFTKIPDPYLADNFDFLLDNQLIDNVELFVDSLRLSGQVMLRNIEKFTKSGYPVDKLNQLVDSSGPSGAKMIKNLKKLTDCGYVIGDIVKFVDRLKLSGLEMLEDIDQLIHFDYFSAKWQALKNSSDSKSEEALVKAENDFHDVVDRMIKDAQPELIIKNLDILKKLGVTGDDIRYAIGTHALGTHYEALIENGINVQLHDLDEKAILQNLDALVKNGYDPLAIFKRLSPNNKVLQYKTFKEKYGVTSEIGSKNINDIIDCALAAEAVDEPTLSSVLKMRGLFNDNTMRIVNNKLGLSGLFKYYDTFQDNGFKIDINKLISADKHNKQMVVNLEMIFNNWEQVDKELFTQKFDGLASAYRKLWVEATRRGGHQEGYRKQINEIIEKVTASKLPDSDQQTLTAMLEYVVNTPVQNKDLELTV
jgi:hypothetical protein